MAILKDTETGDTVHAVKIISSTTHDKDIDTPCDYYYDHQDRLDLVNTLMGGTKAMLDAGTKYLPKETEESDTNYQNRLRRTTLFNAFKRTISYLSGQVFARSVVLKDDVPSEIRGDEKIEEGLVENIDLKGNHLDVFAKKVFETGIKDGTTTVLVDYPPIDSSAIKTKKEVKQTGARPYWVHIPTSSIIGWKTGISKDGQEIFTQLRIREVKEVDDPESPYHTKEVRRVRLLEAFPNQQNDDGSPKKAKWSVYQYDEEKKEWLATGEQGEFSLAVIPLAVFQPGDRISALTADPPLEDLAYMNLAHWQSSSDQMNILHFTRLPILFGRNISDDFTKLEIGPNRLLHSKKENSDLKYVEHTGRSIGAGHAHLVDLETKMAMWGLQLLMPKTGNITATEKALSSGESDSTLKAWAIQFKDFVEVCLGYTAQYLGQETGGSVYVNTEYRWMQTLDAEVLLRAWQFKLLPRRVIFDELQRRGIIGDDVDFVEVMAQFEEEMRTMAESGIDFMGAAQKFLSTDTTPDKSMSAVGSPFAIKRGSGREGGV